MAEDAAQSVPGALRRLADDARVTVRRGGPPARDGKWRRLLDATRAAGARQPCGRSGGRSRNTLELPLVVYFAGIANFPHANLRHYAFLNGGLEDVEKDLAERNISFVLRNAPHESHELFLADVQARC